MSSFISHEFHFNEDGTFGNYPDINNSKMFSVVASKLGAQYER